jgi:protein-S-isoprenylcysteine O-methyltransferase Ste14
MNAINEKIVQYRPPRISMLLLVLAAALQWVTPLVRVKLLVSPVLAVCAAVAGFAVMIWAWALFKRAETAICPTEYSSVLVTSGIYRLSRNPMYLGMILMMASVALWFGTLPYYLAAVLFLLVVNQAFCPFEEQRLTAAFGKEYSNYQRTVRRWV